MRSLAWGALLLFPLTTYAQDQSVTGALTPPVPAVAPLTPAADIETDQVFDSWEEAQAGLLQKRLQAKLSDPNSALTDPQGRPSKRLAQELGVSEPLVTVRKNFPPVANPDGLPEPYLSISFQAAENVIGNPDVERLATKFVHDTLTQNYFSQKFLNDHPLETKLDSGEFRPEYIKVWVGPEDYSGNPFQSPRGLSMPWRILAHRLGYLPSPNSTLSIAFTPNVCREMALKAIRSGLHEDAIVLANHGLDRSPMMDPSFLYLRAYSEINLGKGGDATETIRKLKETRRFPYELQERLNGPTAVYLWQANFTSK